MKTNDILNKLIIRYIYEKITIKIVVNISGIDTVVEYIWHTDIEIPVENVLESFENSADNLIKFWHNAQTELTAGNFSAVTALIGTKIIK